MTYYVPETMIQTLHAVMDQAEADMKSAHEAICKLQGIDPATHDWPAWSPQMNSRHWFKAIRERFPLLPTADYGRPVPPHGSGPDNQ